MKNLLKPRQSLKTIPPRFSSCLMVAVLILGLTHRGNSQTFACACSVTGSLNIDASATNPFYNAVLDGTPYSALEAAFNYDQNNDGVIDFSEHNGCIAIAGRLIIDQNLIIANCPNIAMQPCSEVVVGTNTVHPTLTLSQNSISSCVQMWRGITVTPYAHLVCLDNHPISDAQFAITAVGGSGLGTDPPTSIAVRNNTISDNHVGIFLPSNVFTTVSHIPLVGNTFNTTSPLLPACDAGLANYSSNLGTYAGIVTLGTPLMVGTPGSSGYVNLFQLIRNGVISENGNLEVHRANFQDIRFAGNVNSPPSFALSANIGVLVNGGRGVVRNSNFNLVRRGIYGANNTQLEVTNNLMPSVWRGVETVSTRSFNIRDNNPIGFHNRGIYCREVIPWGGLNGHNISNNILSVVGFPGIPQIVGEVLVAIDIENAMNTALPNARMSENDFTCGGFIFYDGIQISGTQQWTIDFNNMLFLDPVGFNASNTAGIHLTNSTNNYLYHNGVVDFNLTPQSIGFDIGGSTGNRFCCNMTYGDRIGTRFLGACGGTKWRHTKIRFHTYSLFCGAGTMISPQYDYANIFEPSSGTASHEGGSNDILLSQFRVLNMLQPHWPVVVDASAAIQPWFVDQGAAPTCEEDGQIGGACDDPSTDMYPPDSDLDEVDYQAATGQIAQGPYSAMLQWESQRRLYERLHRYPFLNGQGQDIDTFEAYAGSGKVGAYYTAEAAVKAIHDYPASVSNGLLQSLLQVQSNSHAVADKLAELELAETEQDSAAIYQASSVLFAEEYAATAASFATQADAFRQENAIAAQGLVAVLSDDNVLESNRKAVMGIYLQTLGCGIQNLNATQFSTIFSIAWQCPLEGGTAVYMARALYQLSEELTFDDDSLCAMVQERFSPKEDFVSERTEVRLMPTPTSETVEVLGLHASVGQPAQVILTDVNGRRCFDKKISDAKAVISVQDLPSGVYICQVVTKGRPPTALKLIVTH